MIHLSFEPMHALFLYMPLNISGIDYHTTHICPKAEGKKLLGEVVCVQQRGSHLLDRSLLKERNKRISSRYVNVNLQREREKKTNTEATGMLAQMWPIQTVTRKEREQQLVDWCP